MTPHMKLDEKAVEAALCVLLGYRPRLLNELSIDDLCAGLGRMRVSEVKDSLTRAIEAYLSAAHAPQGGVRVPKELVSDERVILKRLADGDTICYAQDGDDAWFTKGDGAWISGPVIIAMRDKGYLLREPWDGESPFDGNDTISDKGRAALKAQP